MKTSIKELESPYLEGELEFVAPAQELSNYLARGFRHRDTLMRRRRHSGVAAEQEGTCSTAR